MQGYQGSLCAVYFMHQNDSCNGEQQHVHLAFDFQVASRTGETHGTGVRLSLMSNVDLSGVGVYAATDMDGWKWHFFPPY